jgi:hypothetical protein
VVTLGRPTEFDEGRAYVTLEWYDDDGGAVLVCWFHHDSIELRSKEDALCSCLRDVMRHRKAAFGQTTEENF